MVVESHSWEEGSVVVAGDNPGGPNTGDNRTFYRADLGVDG